MSFSEYSNNDCTPYFLEQQFIECMNEVDDQSSLSFIHFNCRSLKKNYSKIFYYIDSLCATFSVIGLTETWIKQDGDLSIFIPPKYSYVHCGRKDGRGGGVGILVHEQLNFSIELT